MNAVGIDVSNGKYTVAIRRASQRNLPQLFLKAIFHGAENTVALSLKLKQRRFMRLLVTVLRL